MIYKVKFVKVIQKAWKLCLDLKIGKINAKVRQMLNSKANIRIGSISIHSEFHFW